MNKYAFVKNTLFGNGTARNIPEIMPQGKILAVLGRHAAELPQIKEAVEKIGNAIIATGIAAEPPLEDVDRLIETGRRENVSGVLAIGGGSVIDCAKAAAALIPLEGKTAAYFSGEKKIEHKGLSFAAVPTTAGTGAEFTNNSVLTDTATKIKKSLRHPSMQADFAVVDPELTYSCPPQLTAFSGLDAFVQAFEAYTNPSASSLTRALSAQAAKMILENLEKAYKSPDPESRGKMAEGSMLSGIAFAQCGLGAVHGIAHPVGSLLHVPHGKACAVLMAPVMRFNMPECEKEYSELARLCGIGSSAEDFVNAAVNLRNALNVPETFAEYGLAEEHYPFIVKNCRSNSMKLNPREMSDNDVIEILNGVI